MTDDFRLANVPCQQQPWQGEEPERTQQQVLFSGLDCLPGQQDLFTTEEDKDDVNPTI